MKKIVLKTSSRPAVPADEKDRTRNPTETEVDEANDESFPASDPPSLGGSTRIEGSLEADRHKVASKKGEKASVPPARPKAHRS